MTDYVSYMNLPPPLDFSKHHRSSQDMFESQEMAVLDLRVKKVEDRTDHNCRSMFEAYVASAGTPPSPPSPPYRGHGRTSSESTDDSTSTLTEPPFRNSHQNPPISASRIPAIASLVLSPRATQMRYASASGLDTPLYVSTTGYSPFSISSTPSSREHRARQPSPATQISARIQATAIPDTTVPVTSSSTFPRSRHFDPSQYYSAFHSLPVRDHLQHFTQSSRIPSYLDSPHPYHLPPITEIPHQEAYRALPVTVQSKTKETLAVKSPCEAVFKNPERPVSNFARKMVSTTKSDTDGSGSGSDCEQRQRATSSGQKDEAYWERRRKNNEAAKKSRDARRAKEDEIAVKAAMLEKENICLKLNLAALKKEHQRLMLALR